MPISFQQAFGLDERALMARSQRAELLASNLTNADTPGYKARDLDFQAYMARATASLEGGGTAMARTQSGHLEGASMAGMDGTLKYRQPPHPSLDGNTVDSQMEKAAYARNALDFQASFTFLSGKINTLRSAIRGE